MFVPTKLNEGDISFLGNQRRLCDERGGAPLHIEDARVQERRARGREGGEPRVIRARVPPRTDDPSRRVRVVVESGAAARAGSAAHRVHRG